MAARWNSRGSLDEHEGRRATEIISFVINLEHIGDIIDKNLSEVAAKKIKRNHNSFQLRESLPLFPGLPARAVAHNQTDACWG
jgi:Na+/phosphate symporter